MSHIKHTIQYYYYLCIYVCISRERGWEGGRKEEKHQCVIASCVLPIGDLACNPGMCNDWESNWWPFDLQTCAQSTEPHQPGHSYFYLGHFNLIWYWKINFILHLIYDTSLPCLITTFTFLVSSTTNVRHLICKIYFYFWC